MCFPAPLKTALGTNTIDISEKSAGYCDCPPAPTSDMVLVTLKYPRKERRTEDNPHVTCISSSRQKKWRGEKKKGTRKWLESRKTPKAAENTDERAREKSLNQSITQSLCLTSFSILQQRTLRLARSRERYESRVAERPLLVFTAQKEAAESSSLPS